MSFRFIKIILNLSKYFQTLATGVTEDSRSDSESADDEYEEDSDKKGIQAKKQKTGT